MRKVILSSILIRIFISMMKHPDHKHLGGRKGLFGFHFPITAQHQRKSRQEFKSPWLA